MCSQSHVHRQVSGVHGQISTMGWFKDVFCPQRDVLGSNKLMSRHHPSTKSEWPTSKSFWSALKAQHSFEDLPCCNGKWSPLGGVLSGMSWRWNMGKDGSTSTHWKTRLQPSFISTTAHVCVTYLRSGCSYGKLRYVFASQKLLRGWWTGGRFLSSLLSLRIVFHLLLPKQMRPNFVSSKSWHVFQYISILSNQILAQEIHLPWEILVPSHLSHWDPWLPRQMVGQVARVVCRNDVRKPQRVEDAVAPRHWSGRWNWTSFVFLQRLGVRHFDLIWSFLSRV